MTGRPFAAVDALDRVSKVAGHLRKMRLACTLSGARYDQRSDLVRRRDFIGIVGTAAAWPIAAVGQAPHLPVIGVLGTTAFDSTPMRFSAFHQGLKETGYIEGRNVAIEYRFAEGQPDRLPELAADLVRRQVAVIAASGGGLAALAAKAATSTIPIVFNVGEDPMAAGLVASISRPGGNATGVSLISSELVEKSLELLRELAPGARTIALVRGGGSDATRYWSEHVTAAARAAGLTVLVSHVSFEPDLEAVFASIVREGAGAVLVAATPLFMRRRYQIVALAAQHKLPTIYPWREYCEAGGLMSYGPDLLDAYHQVGRYTGRILNGAAPGDLPVQMPTKFELVINLKTAKALGIQISRLLNARADKVIE
jgi:putative ABC transport system substrate-binding protein